MASAYDDAGRAQGGSINRRLEAVRRLLRWAEVNGAVARNVALYVKSVRVVRERGPLGLTAAEVHELLRATCAWLAEMPEPLVRQAMERLDDRQRVADAP